MRSASSSSVQVDAARRRRSARAGDRSRRGRSPRRPDTRVALPPTPLHDAVDAGGQRPHVVGLDRREHPDAQLVAPELAVGLDVDDAVGAQRGGDGGRVDALVEVDRADDERALGRVGHERRGELRRLGPVVEVATRTPWCARRTSRGRRCRASSRSARPAGTASRRPACCRSGPCASCRARWPARGTRGSSGRSAASSAIRSAPPGSSAPATARRRRRSTSAGRSSRRRPARRRAAGRRRPRWRRSAPARRPGRSTTDHHARRGLVVRPGDDVGVGVAAGRRRVARARPRRRSGRRGTARPAVTLANFAENSPKARCSARSRTSPNAAASQNAVVPPLPSATS